MVGFKKHHLKRASSIWILWCSAHRGYHWPYAEDEATPYPNNLLVGLHLTYLHMIRGYCVSSLEPLLLLSHLHHAHILHSSFHFQGMTGTQRLWNKGQLCPTSSSSTPAAMSQMWVSVKNKNGRWGPFQGRAPTMSLPRKGGNWVPMYTFIPIGKTLVLDPY